MPSSYGNSDRSSAAYSSLGPPGTMRSTSVLQNRTCSSQRRNAGSTFHRRASVTTISRSLSPLSSISSVGITTGARAASKAHVRARCRRKAASLAGKERGAVADGAVAASLSSKTMPTSVVFEKISSSSGFSAQHSTSAH